MTPAGRLSAAIEILEQILTQRRPAADALKDWGLSHRFAGSKDRAAISGLVYDALRVRASAAWALGAQEARAVLLGTLLLSRGLDSGAIAALCDGSPHAPAPLTQDEFARLGAADPLAVAPDWVRGDYPEWLAPALAEEFGGQAAALGHSLAQRAPLDLRVNLLKSSREKAAAQLAHLGVRPTPLSPWGLRIDLGREGKPPALAAEPAFAKGRVEVQDEGSQLAALLSCAQPGWQALDLCAGAAGKTLALAAMMENKGQIYATDGDGRRLAGAFERIARAGARNIQIRPPRGSADVIADLEGRCDLALVDAPCTGSGAWRRNPDAKWRLRRTALEQRMRQQDEVLRRGAAYVKSGGILLYVTCSILRAENEDRVRAFLAEHNEFLPLQAAHLARRAGVPALADFGSTTGAGLRFSPLASGTDGFYVAALLRG